MNKFKLVYIGSINETLVSLSKNNALELIGVNYSEHFNYFVFNPFDQLFIIIYKLHFKKYRYIASALLKIWNKFHFLSSIRYKRNKEYLNVILNYNIEIIDINDTQYLISFLTDNKIDLLVVNSWSILQNEIIDIPKHKTLNIHPSILPQYRGALPTLWSLKNNDNISAVTYIIMNESVDDGLILNQHYFSIELNDDWYSLEKKIASILEITLVEDILNYLNKSNLPMKIAKEVSYTGYYNRYRKIDLQNETAKEIFNKVGLYPFLEPDFYCILQISGKCIYIKATNYKRFNKNDAFSPGKISVKFCVLLMYTKDGILKSHLFKDIGFFDSLFLMFSKLEKEKVKQ